MTTVNIESLRARVQALGHKLLTCRFESADSDYTGLYIVDPKTDELVIVTTGDRRGDIVEVEGWCVERETDAEDADEQQAIAAAFERQKAAGMHADAADPAEHRDEAAAALESIIGTIRLLTNVDDAQQIRSVLRCVLTELHRVDDLVCNIDLPADGEGGAP